MERTHLTASGRVIATDPEGDALEAALEALVADLTAAAAAAAAIAGREPAGIRAIEIAPGVRRFLCAFPGPGFLCVAGDGTPLADARAVHQAATAGLAWEHLEAVVDVERLEDLAAAGARVLALTGEPPDMAAAVAQVVEAGRELAAWRLSPLRAEASIPQVDVATALHERVHRAYARFVTTSEHLVAVQDRLTPDLVAALRAFEEAAGRARVAERLAEVVAQIVSACDAAATEMVEAHITPLAGS